MTAMNVKGNKTMESACTRLEIKLGGELKRDEWREREGLERNQQVVEVLQDRKGERRLTS